jgi:hydroxymethylbilane synthase
MKPSKKCSIKVGARNSPLSRAQVAEIAQVVDMQVDWVETSGDLDKKTSLRTLGKSDFFTRELDAMLLNKQIRAAIHSAKDLPDPLPKGLSIAALTAPIDERDALVFDRLPESPLIATSSERREEAVRQLFPDARFIDLRGTIHERLNKLTTGEADGVVIAEAALIRLGLTHLTRLYLPGPTAEGQGSLAVVCRSDDEEAIAYFQEIHAYSLSRH